MHEKPRTDHRDRAAYVSVRPSTLHQVRHHREGQQRPYGLADRARQLGFVRVVVIDDDLGTSGSGKQTRPGFGRLLTAVCEGGVGAVFALEASREVTMPDLTVRRTTAATVDVQPRALGDVPGAGSMRML